MKINLNAYSTGLLQGTAYARLNTKLTQVLVPFNISIPEWKLLGQLYENPGIKLADLAKHLSYDPPMVTKLIKLLEKKALLKRKQHESDERAKVLVIMPKGKELIEKIEPEVKNAMNEILKGITKIELMIYLKILKTIVSNSQN